MNGRALCAAAAMALLLLGTAAAVAAQSAVHVTDGAGDDWQSDDVVGVSLYPAATAAPLDLESVSAADNATHWFFRISYGLRADENASLALYLFGPDDGSPAPTEPRGHPFTLPAGAPLLYVIYLELVPAFPAGSSLVFFDGISWKNRTFGELSIGAARNVTDGFVEMAAPRESLLFLRAGTLAAAELDRATGVLQDSVPDSEPHPVGYLAGRARFFDYAVLPPIVFTALGFSDPGAVEGQHILIFLELTNTGPKTATEISAQVAIDTTTIGAREGLTLLGGGGTAVLSFEWVTVAGSHNVTAKSFPGGATRTLSAVIAGAQAQLAINGTQVDPPLPAPGAAFTVRVDVHNGGNGPSPATEVLLKDGTKVIARAPVQSLSPGASTQVALPASFPTEGRRFLHVEIDGVNAPNATATVEVAVSAPPGPLGIPPWVLLVVGLAAVGAGMWVLTPRLVAGRPPKPPVP